MNRKEALIGVNIFIMARADTSYTASFRDETEKDYIAFGECRGFIQGSDYERKRAEVLEEALHKIMMLPTRTDRKQFDYETIAHEALTQYQKSEEGV